MYKKEEKGGKKMKMGAKGKGKMWGDIPMDIWADILSRLPHNCVWRLRLVRKNWKSLIEAPSFANLHHGRSRRYFMVWGWSWYHNPNPGPHCKLSLHSIDKDTGKSIPVFVHPFMTITSCINGLISSMGTDGLIEIYNPITRECITLPKPTFFSSSNPQLSSPYDVVNLSDINELRFDSNTIQIGIGFDTTTKRYKVLAINGKNDRHQLEVEIFTLGVRSMQRWRKIDAPFAYLHDQVYANGSFYWFDGDMRGELVTFNFAEEKFEVVSLPPDVDIDGNRYYMHEVGGSLCLVELKREISEEKMTVKLRKLANPTTQAWVDQKISLPSINDIWDVIPISSDMLLLQTHKVSDFEFYICWYNEEGQVVKSIQVHDMPSGFFPKRLYSESILCIRSILAGES